MEGQTRFIFITTPPEPLLSELEAFRRELSLISGSRGALAYPPHITLRTGAILPHAEIPSFINGLRDHLRDASAAPIETAGHHFTEYHSGGVKKHILYYAIKLNRELMDLHRHLLEYRPFIKGQQAEYQPHLTLLFDDLSPEAHALLQQDSAITARLKNNECSWICEHLGLYHKTGDSWTLFERLELA